MMWVLLLLIAVAVFAGLVFVLKLPRSGWELAGAALLLGISGYAVQGRPGQAGAPKVAKESAKAADEATVTERRAMGDKFGSSQNWLILADALTRQGQSIADSDASLAGDMRNIVRTRIAAGEQPEAIRAWLIRRYGSYVSYKPVMNAQTWPLFAAPLALLALAAFLLRGRFARRKPEDTAS